MTLLLVSFQALMGVFGGIPQQNLGVNDVVHLRLEDLVSKASQKRFSPVCVMSAVVASVFPLFSAKICFFLIFPSQGWIRFRITSFSAEHASSFCRWALTENSTHFPGASHWFDEAWELQGMVPNLATATAGNVNTAKIRLFPCSSLRGGTRREAKTLTHWQEERRLLQKVFSESFIWCFYMCALMFFWDRLGVSTRYSESVSKTLSLLFISIKTSENKSKNTRIKLDRPN